MKNHCMTQLKKMHFSACIKLTMGIEINNGNVTPKLDKCVII